MVWAVVAGGGISHLLQLTLNRGVATRMFAAIVVFVALVLVGFWSSDLGGKHKFGTIRKDCGGMPCQLTRSLLALQQSG